MGFVLKSLFGLSVSETILGTPRFTVDANRTRQHLGRIGSSFIFGYNSTLEDSRVQQLSQKFDALDPSLRGFAYEGAAMALTLLDTLTPWRTSRLREFGRGMGHSHIYLLHVGAGWILARKPGNIARFLSRFDPLLRWLILDGYGFHEGFFHAERYLSGGVLPQRIQGYGRRVFDQGFGRCLWFLAGGDVDQVSELIARFASERRPDLWSGVGLAAVYAGGVSGEELERLKDHAGLLAIHLAQGAAFAAKARHRAGTLTEYVDQACQILCDRTGEEAAKISDDALVGLPLESPDRAYETWRGRIREQLASLQEQLA